MEKPYLFTGVVREGREMLRLGIRVRGKHTILNKSNPEKSEQFEALRKRILDHLGKLEESETKQIKKSIQDQGLAKAGVPVGTRHTWKNGIVHVKLPSGKWKRVYEKHDRGAKMAISFIKKRIAAAQDAQEMLKIVLEHRDRFSDAQGNPLPFVQELSAYMRSRGEAIEQAAIPTRAAQGGGKKPDALPNTSESSSEEEHRNKVQDQRNKIKEEMEQGNISRKDAMRVLTDKKFFGYMPTREDAKAFLEEKPKQNDEPEEGGIFDQGREKSDFEKIQDSYKHAEAIEGDEDEIHAGKEIITGKWKLVEAETPTASHDENTFHKTQGFPGNTEDSTVNDRDYEHDREAQEVVIEMAGDYDHQAVSIEKPVVVTKDGIVISGNNRTMSSKIAARKGTDKKYIETLKRRAKKFGFTAEQVAQFKHPRVVFETGENGDYSTEQFAKFNDRQEKSMGPISTAVKISKMMKPKTVVGIAEKIGEFETLGELYSNHKACNAIYGILKDAGHVTMQSMPEYMESGYITENGKSFLENVMLGSVITEKNIRGLNREGCKSIRQKLMRAITPLVENKGMNGYSVTKELNEAIDISMQVAIHKDKFKDVTEYSKQIGMFGEDDPIAIEFAKRLETTQKEFAKFMHSINGGLKFAANGEADVFLGGTESREDILSRLLQIKKAVAEILNGLSSL
jgi:cell pole-organizing protein PopZ